MTSKKWLNHVIGIVSLVVFVGLGLGSAGTTPPAVSEDPVEIAEVGNAPSRAAWSHHTIIPTKDFVAIGAVVVRNANPWTVHADLMEQAIAMAGHDIINVRLSWHSVDDTPLVTATATVIRYTEATIVNETIATDGTITVTARYHPTVGGPAPVIITAPAAVPAMEGVVPVAPQQRGLFPGLLR